MKTDSIIFLHATLFFYRINEAGAAWKTPMLHAAETYSNSSEVIHVPNWYAQKDFMSCGHSKQFFLVNHYPVLLLGT